MEEHPLTLHQCSKGKCCTALLTLLREPYLLPWELQKETVWIRLQTNLRSLTGCSSSTAALVTLFWVHP